MSTELDRLWKRLDEHDQRIDRLETPRRQRVDKLHVDLGVDDCGCPASDELRSQLRAVQCIVAEMLEPSGIPTPAQRLLLRIKDVVDGPGPVVDNTKERDE